MTKLNNYLYRCKKRVSSFKKNCFKNCSQKIILTKNQYKLIDAPLKVPLNVVSLCGCDNFIEKINGMGLCVGNEIFILNRSRGMPIKIKINNVNLAVGIDVAEKIVLKTC